MQPVPGTLSMVLQLIIIITIMQPTVSTAGLEKNGWTKHRFHHSTSTCFNSVPARELESLVYPLEKYKDSDRHKHAWTYTCGPNGNSHTALRDTFSHQANIQVCKDEVLLIFPFGKLGGAYLSTYNTAHSPGIWLKSLTNSYTQKQVLYTTWGESSYALVTSDMYVLVLCYSWFECVCC